MIITNEEVAKAIYVDPDFDPNELKRLSDLASNFIFRKTGYNFAEDLVIEPLAVECAIQYIRQIYFGSKGYNREHDYMLGIVGIIKELQEIAHEKLSKKTYCSVLSNSKPKEIY